MKRPNGFGTITELPDGRFWVRAPRQNDGTRPHIGYFPTLEEAERKVAQGLHASANKKRVVGETFAAFARNVLDEREHSDVRGIKAERLRFKKHLETADFAELTLPEIKPRHIVDWLKKMGQKKAADKRGERGLSSQTIKRALSLASVIFDAAGPQGSDHIETNPCNGLKVKARSTRTEDPWTWLTLEEQHAIAASANISGADKRAILFALGTGLRLGEQFNLEIRDVHVDGDHPHVVVRFGSKGKAPKSGKIRRVSLFGFGLEAAKAQLEALGPARHRPPCPNDYGLLFPAPRGGRRGQKPLGNGFFDDAGQYHDRFEDVLKRVGITRNVRWHDLRHTFCSSLVQGLWGEPWSLEEIKEAAGHSTIIITQRYAHLGETAQRKAAKKVTIVGGSLVENGGVGRNPLAAITNDFNEVGRPGLEPGTYGLKGADLAQVLRVFTAQNGPNNQLATQLAATLVSLLEAGR